VVVPETADLDKAAALLNAGTKIAILVGAEGRGASDELLQAADLLGAGIAKALLGKDVLPDDLPYVTGAIGLLGTEPSWNLMQQCDALLMVGTGLPWAEFLPKDEKVRAVQIDIDPAMLSLRFPAEVNLHGDAAETLRLLIPKLQRKTDRSWREDIESGVEAWWKKLEGRPT
jgi:pyruvate dehydrogenase (quinone)